ncbi:hypothetical protein OSTOST_18562, partial [Ostertagia ostertagi]
MSRESDGQAPSCCKGSTETDERRHAGDDTADPRPAEAETAADSVYLHPKYNISKESTTAPSSYYASPDTSAKERRKVTKKVNVRPPPQKSCDEDCVRERRKFKTKYLPTLLQVLSGELEQQNLLDAK